MARRLLKRCYSNGVWRTSELGMLFSLSCHAIQLGTTQLPYDFSQALRRNGHTCALRSMSEQSTNRRSKIEVLFPGVNIFLLNIPR